MNNRIAHLKKYLSGRRRTLLCVGPMSRICIDASVEISKTYSIPMVLIASRRQVEAAEFDGGYVENFTTEAFSRYVRSKGAKLVYLARDHGGPWQGPWETANNLPLRESMESSKRSFEVDILSGFDFIHIDPSIPVGKETLTLEMILDRLCELYESCYAFSKRHRRNVGFELGSEEQGAQIQDPAQFDYFLRRTTEFCKKNRIPTPLFVVAQTGAKVIETRNIGVFQSSPAEANHFDPTILDRIRKTVATAKRYGVLIKEHNADYLCAEALSLRPFLGIAASNVAPEFGVAETRAFLYLLKTQGLRKEFDQFVEIAINSKKWEKWMMPRSSATEIDKAIICGHYIFSKESVRSLRSKVARKLASKGIDLETCLRNAVKTSILRYVNMYNMR